MQFLRKVKTLFLGSSVGISLGMGIVKLLKAILQIALLVLAAKYFGVSAKRDSWIISVTIVMVLIQFFFGPLNETLRARFIHLREDHGEKYALDSAISLFRFTCVISLLLIVLACFFSTELVQFFGGSMTSKDSMSAIFMIRIVIPSLLLNQVVNFWTSILNTYDSFYLPDLLGLLSNIINVLVLIFITPLVGIYSLAISMYLSLILLVFVLALQLSKIDNRFLYFGSFTLNHLKPYVLFSLPFYLSYLCGQLAVVLEKKMSANLGVGKLSVLDYSRKFIDLPLSILITISATIITPIMANAIVKKDFNKYSVEIVRFISMSLLLVLPLITIFVVCPLDFSIFFFGKSSFIPKDFEMIAKLMSYYAIGIIGVIFYTVSGQALVSERRVKFYSIVAILTQLIPIIINIIFYRNWGLITFGISWSVSHLIFGVIMFCSLKIKLLDNIIQIFKIFVIFIVVIFLSFSIYNSLHSFTFIVRLLCMTVCALIFETILFLGLNKDAFAVVNKFFKKKTSNV